MCSVLADLQDHNRVGRTSPSVIRSHETDATPCCSNSVRACHLLGMQANFCPTLANSGRRRPYSAEYGPDDVELVPRRRWAMAPPRVRWMPAHTDSPGGCVEVAAFAAAHTGRAPPAWLRRCARLAPHSVWPFAWPPPLGWACAQTAGAALRGGCPGGARAPRSPAGARALGMRAALGDRAAWAPPLHCAAVLAARQALCPR